MANRLAAERSPYLLQHAENPVDWYPWGEEAFDRARREDRPIFLSVGYSTCHWCHVMEHESFESDAIARVLNEHFVSIKVDREERPDVDRVYMTFVQMTTGAGGWPMSVWLTPELKPFFGGTYFPPASRWGRPGFLEVLEHIARLWRTERPRLVASAESLLAQLRDVAADRVPASEPDAGPLLAASRPPVVAGVEALEEGVRAFRAAYDGRYGGFGSAPKFPRPSELLFLLREHARTGEPAAREMVLETLKAMSLGGMRDHIGGGFHRYSVDARWRVSHFEKMLYDQAQLVLALLEASQVSGDGLYAAIAEDTLAYVLRDLRHPEGAFLSAEDADSIPPELAGRSDASKTEGAFYLWTEDEVNALVDADASAIVRARFGIEPAGNVLEDPHGEFGAKNILYVAMSIEDVAIRVRKPVDEVMAVLASARQRMFDARRQRPRPHLDDKVLTAWNGLMIAACARAARVLQPNARAEADALLPGAQGGGRPDYLAAAEAAARFVLTRLWDGQREVLLRRFRDGDAGIDGYCEDYACFIWGLLELFQASGSAEWLGWARRLQARQNALFWDAANGGWFSTTGDDETVLVRVKEDYDGAEPAASSVAVMNLMTLAHLDGDPEAFDKIERTLARGGTALGRAARAVPFMLCNLSAFHAGTRQLVVVGPHGRDDTRAMLSSVASVYQPFAVVVPVTTEEQPRLAGHLPFIGAMGAKDGKATAYLCRNFACDEPTTDLQHLAELLHRPVVLSRGNEKR